MNDLIAHLKLFIVRIININIKFDAFRTQVIAYSVGGGGNWWRISNGADSPLKIDAKAISCQRTFKSSLNSFLRCKWTRSHFEAIKSILSVQKICIF